MVRERLSIGMFSCLYSQINGSAHAVRFLSEELAKLGHDVHVFAPRIVNGHQKPKHLHYHDMGGARVADTTGFILSFPLHQAFAPAPDYLDVAHIQTHVSIGALAIHWAKRTGTPIIGSHHSPMTYYTNNIPIVGKFLMKNDLIWRYERLMMEKYDLCHVPTPTKKEMLLNYRFKEPIVALTNGIRDFYFKNVNPNGIFEKYGIKKDKKVMLYASRLAPEKHPIRVIKSFRNIHRRVPDAHLLLVGSAGQSSKAVEKIVQKRKYRDYVSYGGRVSFEDLVKLYNAADVSGLWSWVEAEGLVLLEAMAQGTPNVGTNASGIANVIRHGKTGYLANDLPEFEDYVVKLLKDDELRRRLGENAREVAEEYRLENVARNWVDIYKLVKDQLYPLRYHGERRTKRVKIAKEFARNKNSIHF